MKFKLSIVTFLLIIMLTGCKEEQTVYFNDIGFYSTINDVKSKVSKTPYKEYSDKLIYEDNLYGYNVYIMYTFENNKLNDTFISFKPDCGSNKEYQSRYDTVKTALINKYGKKNLVEVKDNCSVWNQDGYQILLNMNEEFETSILYSKNK